MPKLHNNVNFQLRQSTLAWLRAHPPRAPLLRDAFAIALLAAAACGGYAENDGPSGRLITSMGLAINLSTHKVYAVDETSGRVLVTDEQTGATRAVKVDDGPIAVAINQATNRAYVVNTDSNSISVIDGRQDAVIATIQGGSHPYVVSVNEKTNKIYVTYTYDN